MYPGELFHVERTLNHRSDIWDWSVTVYTVVQVTVAELSLAFQQHQKKTIQNILNYLLLLSAKNIKQIITWLSSRRFFFLQVLAYFSQIHNWYTQLEFVVTPYGGMIWTKCSARNIAISDIEYTLSKPWNPKKVSKLWASGKIGKEEKTK